MALVGSREPRLFTPPLRKLTRRTSKGFEVIDFSEKVLGLSLMPWQKWLLIHGLELLPNGQYRWRTVVVLVSRQNGKTSVLAVLALWRLLLDNARLVLGTSTNLDYARESWEYAVSLAEESEEAADEFRWPPRRTNGEQTFTTTGGARYKIAAANRRGGRSLSVDLGIADELREHQTWEAWAALSGTTTARPDPQLWALSNAGDDTSIVLNHYRDTAVATLEAGEDPGDVALFEWSAPLDAELDDRQAWAMSNPALGHTITEQTMLGKLKLPPAVFRTEHMCIRVPNLDAAIPLDGWHAGADPNATLDGVRDRVAVCVDVSPDLAHVTLVAAGQLDDGRVRAEAVQAWPSVDDMRLELPKLLKRIKPRATGWFPNGPGAVLNAEFTDRPGFEPLRDTTAVCQGLAEQVTARRILHADDPLLTAQVGGASKLYQGDGWRFVRKGAGHVDGVYALAGAVHLARTLPPPIPRPMVVVGRQRVT